MDVRQRAGIQRIEAILIPHGPKHPYPWVGIRDLLDSLGVFLRERSTSDNKQWVGRIAARISENSLCHMVFRFEPGDDDVEALELQVVTQQVDIAAGKDGCPVGDEVGGRAEFLAVVISDSFGRQRSAHRSSGPQSIHSSGRTCGHLFPTWYDATRGRQRASPREFCGHASVAGRSRLRH